MAQSYVFGYFRTWFLARHPDGVVLSELEYMGATTTAFRQPRSPTSKNPMIDHLLETLGDNFRRWNRQGDYRKFDAIGISGTGTYGELIEITTEANSRSAITQLRDKLDTLRTTINRISTRPSEWVASSWRPAAGQMSFETQPEPERRWVCYQPTVRMPSPVGVILYEVHGKKRKRSRQRTKQVELTKFDSVVKDLQSAIRSQLQKGILDFDPGSPEYVVIIPERLYQHFRAHAAKRSRDAYKPRYENDFPGGNELHAFNAAVLPKMEVVFAALVGGYAIEVAGGTLLLMSESATVTTTAGASTAAAEVAAAQATRAAQAAYDAAQLARAEATVAQISASRSAASLPGVITAVARASTPALQRMAAGAGVLYAAKFIESTASADPLPGDGDPIRVVAASDFVRFSGIASASSPGAPKQPGFGVLGSGIDGFPAELNLQARVLFNGIPNIVIAQVKAQ